VGTLLPPPLPVPAPELATPAVGEEEGPVLVGAPGGESIWAPSQPNTPKSKQMPVRNLLVTCFSAEAGRLHSICTRAEQRADMPG
jgi:hypothetical protein